MTKKPTLHVPLSGLEFSVQNIGTLDSDGLLGGHRWVGLVSTIPSSQVGYRPSLHSCDAPVQSVGDNDLMLPPLLNDVLGRNLAVLRLQDGRVGVPAHIPVGSDTALPSSQRLGGLSALGVQYFDTSGNDRRWFPLSTHYELN